MARETADHRLAIFNYVQRRLERDCKMRGEATRIVKATGFAPSTITKIKEGERKAGDDFIHAIREYWGLSYDELERIALGLESEGPIEGRPAESAGQLGGEPHPNLRETLDWLRSQNYLYPPEFLDEYERQAQRQPYDPPRAIIMADLQARYWHWCQGRGASRIPSSSSTTVARPLPADSGRGRPERSGMTNTKGNRGRPQGAAKG